MSVGALVLQGSHSDHPGWSERPPKGSQSDHPIDNTIINTIKNTINCGEPQSEEILKIQEVISGKDMKKENIFDKAKRKEGKLTPGGCGYLWRNCRSSAGENGFQAELRVADQKILHTAQKRVGELYPEVVWGVMSNWGGFTKHAEKTAGAFNCPSNPSVPFFAKFIEAAASFVDTNDGAETTGFVQLSATAKKPLTKPKASTDNVHKAATLEEIMATNKDIL